VKVYRQKGQEPKSAAEEQKQDPKDSKSTTDAKKEKKQKDKKPYRPVRKATPPPDSLLVAHETNETITNFRKKLAESWDRLKILEVTVKEAAEKVDLKEGESIEEELKLAQERIEFILKQKEERQAGLIKKFYSGDSKYLLLSNFVFEKHLVNEVDNKEIYVLGHFLRDPTENKCVISFEKTEFIESEIKEIFNY